jgi:hypothetical protein
MAEHPGQTLYSKIKVVDNIFCVEDVLKINEYLKKPLWKFGQVSGDLSTKSSWDRKFWIMQLSDEKYFNDYLFEIICDVLGKKYDLERIYANGQTYGLDGYWHIDNIDENCYTFLYYANLEWDILWKGNTIFTDKESGEIVQIVPKPNRAILFPGNILHYAESPSRDFYDLRMTLAYKLKQIS